MKKISVFTKLVGQPPRHVWISDTLENLQRYVGGYIEVFPLTDAVAIICNEEGKLNGMKYNCTILGEQLFGDIIFVGTSGEEFCDIPIHWDAFKVLLPHLFEKENNYA